MMFNLNFITMKKKYFLSAIALCGLMTLASCGSDDDPIPEKVETTRKQLPESR